MSPEKVNSSFATVNILKSLVMYSSPSKIRKRDDFLGLHSFLKENRKCAIGDRAFTKNISLFIHIVNMLLKSIFSIFNFHQGTIFGNSHKGKNFVRFGLKSGSVYIYNSILGA